MLVNLSYDPKSRVRVDREHKLCLQECPGHDECDKEYRRVVKWHRKIYTFKGFFRPHQPSDWEFVKGDPSEVLTGVYDVRDMNQIEAMINLCTKQSANKRRVYDSGDAWYSFGLCDNASQAIAYYKEMKSEGKFHGNHIIALQPMGKGGWRWHKWGAYIGEFAHKCEYFCDEEGIENVYSFEIVPVV